MSLDIYLIRKRHISYDDCKTFDIDYEDLFHSNITHNLNEMADEAGLYETLWRPYRLNTNYDVSIENTDSEYTFESNNQVIASDLITSLENGLAKLKSDSNHFKQFNPSNGWGNYDVLVSFVEKYLFVCKQYPYAIVNVSR